ncbi:hypothetical protein FRB95_013731 [Tulasnella sp. JGI-2019a]|nr:hypothetical protein FRB95_013731 [Tulasnella sp. JGI-2019a]
MSSLYMQQRQIVASTSASVVAFQAPRGALVDYSSPSCNQGSDDEQDDIDGEPIEDEDPRSMYRVYRDYLATRPTQEPQAQPPTTQPSPQSLKRQRDDEPTTATTSPRSGGSPSHVRHIPTVSPSRQRTAQRSTTPAATDEESAPPAKRTRVDIPPTPTTTVVSVPPTPILDNPVPPTAKPSPDRRPSRQATKPGNSYAERQAKLAEVSDSKKRADLKKKVKVAVATRAASNRSETGLGEVATSEAAVAATLKAKKVAATMTGKRMKKAAEVKESSKKATVKTKAKTKKAANSRTQTAATSTSTVPRRSTHTQPTPVPVVGVGNGAEGAAAGVGSQGEVEEPAVLPRRSDRLRR